MTREPRAWTPIPLSETRAVEVTARLQSGAVLPLHWPAPLDGILAHAARRRRLGVLYGQVADHHVEGLPLTSTACNPSPDCGRKWVWAASCASPVGASHEDLRYWHQRFDDLAATTVVDALPAQTDVGRYKPWRTPMVATVATHLRWTALGDPDAIRDLLTDVVAVGKKTSQGEGMVLDWTVTDTGPPSWGAVTWHDRTIARPFPARAASSLGLTGPDTVPGVYRPPYWRPRHVTDHGTQTRQWQEVIAPWTTKP